MDNQLLAQMNQRMDEHYDYLRGQIDELADGVRSMQATLVARMDAHEDYHRRNEHRCRADRLHEFGSRENPRVVRPAHVSRTAGHKLGVGETEHYVVEQREDVEHDQHNKRRPHKAVFQ